MEGKPHSHQPTLRREYDEGPWQIRYGDTKVRVCGGWTTPTTALVQKAIRKAIEKHDKGSRKAEEREKTIRAAEAETNSWRVKLDPFSWGSEQFKEK